MTPIRSPYFSLRIIRGLSSSHSLRWCLLLLLTTGVVNIVGAQQASPVTGLSIPKISLGIQPSSNPKDIAVSLQVLLLLTVLTLAPSILIMCTAFTRIVIVLSLMRSALGIPQVPPNQVLVGLSLFLTFFVMRPVLDTINDEALQPYFANKITFQD